MDGGSGYGSTQESPVGYIQTSIVLLGAAHSTEYIHVPNFLPLSESGSDEGQQHTYGTVPWGAVLCCTMLYCEWVPSSTRSVVCGMNRNRGNVCKQTYAYYVNGPRVRDRIGEWIEQDPHAPV